MRIVGPPSATYDRVYRNLGASTVLHLRFRGEMLQPLWEAALDYHIDPVGVVAQAAKETGWGHYPGKVRPEFYNTCGLKIRHQALFPGITDGDNPLAHQMFPNWQTGAKAHVQHLCAYAGESVFEPDVVDPRYEYVTGKHALENFEELGGKWAPSLAYGNELVTIARKLQMEPV